MSAEVGLTEAEKDAVDDSLALYDTVARIKADAIQQERAAWVARPSAAEVDAVRALMDADPEVRAALAELCVPRGEERAEQASGPGWFWTQSEWAEWSNELAMLIPEDDIARYANPDGAQESIIADCLRAYISERAEATS